MIDSEDPIITALSEHEDKLDWQDRKDLWLKHSILAHIATGLAYCARIVGTWFT